MDERLNPFLFNILVIGEKVLGRDHEDSVGWAICEVKYISRNENRVIVRFDSRKVDTNLPYDYKLLRQLPTDRGGRRASQPNYNQLNSNRGPIASSSHSSTPGKVGGGAQSSTKIQYGGGKYASGFTSSGGGGNSEPDHTPKKLRINESTQTPSSTASFDVGISRHSAFSPGASILSSTTPMRRCGMDPGAYAEESAKLMRRCDNAAALIHDIQARWMTGEPDGM
jgi:hypothetical protein